MQQIEDGLYCFLIPPNYDGTLLMKEMWTRAVLPETIARRARMYEEIRRSASFQEMSLPMREEEISAQIAKLIEECSKWILTVDGCWQQIESFFRHLNRKLIDENCEAYKFAAASTMCQQPNDVGRMHCNMHGYYKSAKYLTQTSFHVPFAMQPLRKMLLECGLDKASFTTYWTAICQLPDCLAKSYQPSTVRDGFRKSGIWPVDISLIMSGWAGWSKVPLSTAKIVIERIPDLALLARKGRLYDAEIERPFADLLTFDPNQRKSDTCAINHGRCIWINNPIVMESYREKQLAHELEEIEKDNEYMHRQFRAEYPVEAAADDAMERERLLPAVVDGIAEAVIPLPRKLISCGNASCPVTATALVRKSWSGCRKKRCRILFCNKVACAAISVQHQAICMK